MKAGVLLLSALVAGCTVVDDVGGGDVRASDAPRHEMGPLPDGRRIPDASRRELFGTSHDGGSMPADASGPG